MLESCIFERFNQVFYLGGTSACVIAGRLAAADPSLKILLLESGPHIKGKMEHIQAGQYITHLMPTSKTMQFYESTPSPNTAGRSVVVPSGMCVGGG
jgi:alcohol oxidase